MLTEHAHWETIKNISEVQYASKQTCFGTVLVILKEAQLLQVRNVQFKRSLC